MTLAQFKSALKEVGIDIITSEGRKAVISKLSCHYKSRAMDETKSLNWNMADYYQQKHETLRDILNERSTPNA